MASPTPISYVIYLTDQAALNQFRAANPQGVKVAPAAASVAYSAPIWGDATGGLPVYPGISIPGGVPSYASVDIASGTVPGTGYTDPSGNRVPDNEWYWVGYALLGGAGGTVAPPPPVDHTFFDIGTIKFLCGFEALRLGDGETGNYRLSRDASRFPDGIGYAQRSNVAEFVSFTMPSPLVSYDSERFYIRLRRLPAGSNEMVWSIFGSVEGGGPALYLAVTPTGTLALYNLGNGALPGTVLLTSAALGLNRWHRVDLTYYFKPSGSLAIQTTPAPESAVSFSLDGATPIIYQQVGLTNGLGVIQTHLNSALGNRFAASAGLECDLDDWTCAHRQNAFFTSGDPAVPDSGGLYINRVNDVGSHIRLVRPVGYTGPSWSGNFRLLLSLPAEGGLASDVVTSATANAALSAQTDYSPTRFPGSQGVTAIQACGFVFAAITSCRIGSTVNGGQQLDTVSTGGGGWVKSLRTLGGAVVNTLAIDFIKDATVAGVSLVTLVALVDYLGVFGPEDAPVGLPQAGIHEAPYPESPYAQPSLTPLPLNAPVSVRHGVYTGNNIGQDVLIPAAAHWWWVRPLAGDNGGVFWWSSCTAAAPRVDSGLTPPRMTRAQRQSDASGSMSVAGTINQANATGVSYEWVAVSDPSHRFCLNGAFIHHTTIASIANPLQDLQFTPEAIFLTKETLVAGTQHYYKGPGHAAANASKLDAAEAANIITLGAGSLISQTALHNATNCFQTPYSAWRRADPNGATLPAILSYVGDGAPGTRIIPLALGGQTAVFTLVVPHNGPSFFRDPSHAGTTSSQVTGAINAATAITDTTVPDQITVGTVLNAGGITYDVFALPGNPVVAPPIPGGCGLITILPGLLPAAEVGQVYNQALTASGGDAPYSFISSPVPGSLNPGSGLPPGLVLSAAGVLSGTPLFSGTFSFVVTAIDNRGCQGSLQYDLCIRQAGQVCPLITIDPTTLPQGRTFIPYSQTLVASGGTSPYRYAVTTGALPPGLSISSSGVISGSPTADGVFNFTVTATDFVCCTGTRAYALTIIAACPVITLAPALLPNGAVGVAYTQILTAAGDTPPYTFAVVTGALPQGLTLTAAGLLSGIPVVGGTAIFSIQATAPDGCQGSTIYALTVTGGGGGVVRPCPTLADALVDLASRLSDRNLVHWTATELTRYVWEALRTWQAWTLRHKAQGFFTTDSGQPFYYVPDELPALCGYNVLDSDLVTDIQYALQEPPTAAWTGTEQFTLTDLTQALQSRLDRFLRETGIVLTRDLISILPVASGRFVLPTSIVTVRRAAFIQGGAVTPLQRSDEWNMNAFLPAWPTAPGTPALQVPFSYSVGVAPPFTMQIVQPPLAAGTLDLLTIHEGNRLDPATGILMGMPDDWTWAIKWGALADLLDRDGIAHDPLRAAYCEARFRHATALASSSAIVLAARITNSPVEIGTFSGTDQFRPDWQTTPATPEKALMAGPNLLALAPPPNAPLGVPYTVTLDVVTNHPIPRSPGDCLGIDWAEFDDILDYAEHLAYFKEGPDQLQNSLGLLDRFQGAAGLTERLDRASWLNKPGTLDQTSQAENLSAPRLKPPTPPREP